MDQKELPRDRLATTDVKGKRVYLYPANVKGRFKALRNQLQTVLILFFLIMPWIKINGHQALLFDIPQRRFAIFGLTFWAHDAPMVFFVLAGFVFSLVFVTAIWGRVWCGYACPQTVFIEHLYRRIENLIEGNHLERKKFDQSPLSLKKFSKKLLKWFAFLILSMIITHSFLAYFVGAENVMQMIQKNPSENLTSFLVILFSTGIILFDFGWFREQFCIIACPYGRFQSVLMDRNSMAVTYDMHRSDCVDCYRCVSACPTGIDIRRGMQMECIACTACMDACDDVMSKMKRPLGLIRYDSENGLAKEKVTKFSPRLLIYTIILIVVAVGLTYNVVSRKPVEMAFLRAKEAPYQEVQGLQGMEIINHFRLELSNYEFDDVDLHFEISGEEASKGLSVISQMNPVQIKAGKVNKVDIFVKAPKDFFINGRAVAHLLIDANSKPPYHTMQEMPLVGPFH